MNVLILIFLQKKLWIFSRTHVIKKRPTSHKIRFLFLKFHPLPTSSTSSYRHVFDYFSISFHHSSTLSQSLAFIPHWHSIPVPTLTFNSRAHIDIQFPWPHWHSIPVPTLKLRLWSTMTINSSLQNSSNRRLDRMWVRSSTPAVSSLIIDTIGLYDIEYFCNTVMSMSMLKVFRICIQISCNIQTYLHVKTWPIYEYIWCDHESWPVCGNQ